MNRTQKGSITVEAIVMLGLIATLTPILYKHVAERRQDIENINEANTLLLLKNATAEYIEANKDTLTTRTLEPIDIGIDISGHQIGIRKDSSGNIDAMITGVGGNDLKAAKIASLLGVSAGIYSAQNTAKAWGINGVWAENISNYGFSSLPTGIPVITTAYDKEDPYGLNEEQLKDFIENTTFDKVTAKQFCLDNSEIPEEQRCIDKWQFEKCSELIGQCDLGAKCNDAYNKRCNQTCNDILISYRTEGNFPTSDYAFRLTGSNPNGETNKTKCYFTSSSGYNAVELIEACNTGNNDACTLANTYGLNTTCQKIMDSYQTLSLTPNNGTYKLGTGTDTACWFKNTTGYSTKEVIEKCNSNTAIACQIGNENKLNRTCAEVQTSMKSYGTTPANGSYKLTLTSASGSAYTCDMSQTPALTEYFYKNASGTYTFSLLNQEISYKFELCGASNSNGKAYGGYSWGKKVHSSPQSFFVIVGGMGLTVGYIGAGGGTELRHGTSGWQDKHRILVGGGASGAWNSSYTSNSGGGGNNCGAGSNNLGGCKGLGGIGSGNSGTATALGIGGQYLNSGYGGGRNGGAYGGGGGGGGANSVAIGGNGTASSGGSCPSFSAIATGYNGGKSWKGESGGFGGGGGGDVGSGGGGYGGGGGGGAYGSPTHSYIGGGGGGRVCLASMPAGWPACDPSVWVFDEGSGETGSDKCPGAGWVKVSVIEIIEES